MSNRETMPDVYTPAVQCPACESTDVVAYKTLKPERDGSITRYVQCRGCKTRFRLITEPREPGDDDGGFPESGTGPLD